MANLEKWTQAAREAENNSVIVAVPAQSHGTWSGENALDMAGGSISELVIGSVLVGMAGVHHSINRLRDRRKALGKREQNDRVAILFYPDRVDLHSRRPVVKQVGRHLESHPLSEVDRPELTTIRIAGVLSLIHI